MCPQVSTITMSSVRTYTVQATQTAASPQSPTRNCDWTERNKNGRMKHIDWKSGRRLSEKQAWTRYKRHLTANSANFLLVFPTRWNALTSERTENFTSSSLCENSATNSCVWFLQIYPWTPWNGRNCKRKCRDSLWGRRNFISASF
jgi:hypothetical protein